MGLSAFFRRRFRHYLGIDLGTANTVIYTPGSGIICREPSVVAVDRKTQKILAIGEEAREMVGRTPGNIIAVRPLKDGVIADFDMTETMIRSFINTANAKSSRLFRSITLIGIPWGITAVEKRAVVDASTKAGAYETYLIEEPMAAAIGAGLKIEEPKGQLVIDIGGGTTEVAVISLGGIVVCKSVRIAGDAFDDTIMSHCRKYYNLLIGERMAEKVKIEIGSVFPFGEEQDMEVKGRDLLSGLPKTFTISSAEIRDALSEPVSAIIDILRLTLEKTPPELVSDIVDNGIVLTGGGSLLKGLDLLIYEETKIKVVSAIDPLSCVALGTGMILDNMNEILPILSSTITYQKSIWS